MCIFQDEIEGCFFYVSDNDISGVEDKNPYKTITVSSSLTRKLEVVKTFQKKTGFYYYNIRQIKEEKHNIIKKEVTIYYHYIMRLGRLYQYLRFLSRKSFKVKTTLFFGPSVHQVFKNTWWTDVSKVIISHNCKFLWEAITMCFSGV